MGRLTFEEREKRAIAEIEGRMMNREARRLAERKIKLGMKYGELDFQNISDTKLTELEKREKKEERKQKIFQRGKEIISRIGSKISETKATRNIGRTEPRGTFATSEGGGVFGTMQHKNIHEGVGRNIWEDKPKKTIWDK